MAFFAFAASALMLGGAAAKLFLVITSITFCVTLINTFVSVGLLRAISIGFTIPVILYAAALCFTGQNEFDPQKGLLPSSKLIQKAYESVYSRTYIDVRTQQVLADFDERQPHHQITNGPSFPMMGPGANVGAIVYPVASEFMQSSHIITAFSLGFFGALYARWLFDRQSSQLQNAE